MEKQQIDDLKNKVESRLLQKITDLEAIKLELQEEIKVTDGAEKERNQNLYNATATLLDELKKAQTNIHLLIERNSTN